jgi:hypothetical protein
MSGILGRIVVGGRTDRILLNKPRSLCAFDLATGDSALPTDYRGRAITVASFPLAPLAAAQLANLADEAAAIGMLIAHDSWAGGESGYLNTNPRAGQAIACLYTLRPGDGKITFI